MASLPQKTGGKLIDTWTYAYRGAPADFGADEEKQPQLVQDCKVTFRVYIVKEQKALHEPPHLTAGVSFKVECEQPLLRLEGTDLELLRKEAFARCDAHFATKWEKWYLVEVIPQGSYQGSGTGLIFQYRDVERGVAWDGTVLLKDRDWNARRYEEKISAWPGEFTNRNGRIVACIIASPANTAALEEFTRRIDLLREALEKMLTPENILTTLLHLSSLTLLPAAPLQTVESGEVSKPSKEGIDSPSTTP